jgi:excisionase family DNA binding protein
MVRMVTADEAANLAGVTTRTVYSWVEQGKVHFTETEERKVLVCVNSLA